MLDQVKRILRENSLCVICTEGGGFPHCSLMTYIPSDDIRILYMVSRRDSKKYKNLMRNPNVSVLVDTRENFNDAAAKKIVSVTFEGVYQPVEHEELEHFRTRLTIEHLELNEILKNPNSILIGIALKSFLLLNGPVDSYQGDL